MRKSSDKVTIESSTRRAFLRGGLGAAVAASALEISSNISPAVSAPAVQVGAPDVAVIGAGAFGGWTALNLREKGAKVTLVDAYGPGNKRATSCGETRQIRYGYGDREMYTRSVVKAMKLWKDREREWGVKLLFEGTRLSMSSRGGARLEAQKAIFGRLGLAYEMVKHDELSRRYPQISFEGIEESFVEPGVAMIKAKDAMLKVAEAFERKGGTITTALATPGSASGRRLEAVSLNGSDTLRADTFIFACGPWLRKMFPNVLNRKLVISRCDVVFFGQPAGDTRFTWPNFPQLNGEFSTYPVFSGGGGLKVIPVGGGAIDPDNEERIVSPEQVKRARDYISRRIPALKNAPIIENEVCQFEMASGGDFIIDKHPDFDNVWIVGGGSAHGFKHGPTLGEYIGARVRGEAGDPDLAKVYSIADHKDVGTEIGMGG